MIASDEKWSAHLGYELLRKRWTSVLPIMIRCGLLENIAAQLPPEERQLIPPVRTISCMN